MPLNKFKSLSLRDTIRTDKRYECGDIIYDNKFNHYGVAFCYLRTFQNGEIIEENVEYVWYFPDSGHFYNPCVSVKYIEHIKNDLPEDLKFFYGLSNILSHTKADYSVIDDDWVESGYNLPLIEILKGRDLVNVIDRCAYVNKNIFTERPELFLYECIYEFKQQWGDDGAGVVFYRG